MIVRPTAQGPVILALGFLDRHVVDARIAALHKAILAELPVLVAVGAEPVARVVVPFVGVAYGNAIAAERPQFLDQTILVLLLPLALEERLRFRSIIRELCAIAPFRVERIGERDLGGVPRIPAIFRETDFLDGGFACERRKRRTEFGVGRHGVTSVAGG